MKINELLAEEQIDELAPGEVPSWYNPRKYFGQGKANAQALKQDKAYAKQIYKQWSNVAVRVKQALKNDPYSNYKEAEYFKDFLAKALRLQPASPAQKVLKTMFGRNNAGYPKLASEMIDKVVAMRFLTKDIQNPTRAQVQPRQPGARQPRAAQPQAQPQAAATANKTVNAGNLGAWTWNGTQWVNPSGAPAGGNLIATLDQLAAQQGIVK